MKKHKSISDKAMVVISVKQIRPIPRWEFMAKNWGWWLFLGILVVGGGAAIAVSIYMNRSNDWDLQYFPIFWLGASILFLVTAYAVHSRTKGAYRYNYLNIGLILAAVSMVLGVIMTKIDVGNKIDSMLAKDVPAYRQIAPMKLEVWMNPEEGRISGRIGKIRNKDFELIDFNGQSWMVDANQAHILGGLELETGQEVKVLGRITGQKIFEADEIKPWAGPGWGQGKRGGRFRNY